MATPPVSVTSLSSEVSGDVSVSALVSVSAVVVVSEVAVVDGEAVVVDVSERLLAGVVLLGVEVEVAGEVLLGVEVEVVGPDGPGADMPPGVPGVTVTFGPAGAVEVPEEVSAPFGEVLVSGPAPLGVARAGSPLRASAMAL
jgi:hypothetical protein